MAQVKLNNKQYDKKNCLAINIGENTYNMPLAPAMSIKMVKKMADDPTFDGMLEVLTNYIPEEVLDELTYGNLEQIVRAWYEASEKLTGMDVGK